jgi:hypothetical protein
LSSVAAKKRNLLEFKSVQSVEKLYSTALSGRSSELQEKSKHIKKAKAAIEARKPENILVQDLQSKVDYDFD